jgi:WD40 repeat protein
MSRNLLPVPAAVVLLVVGTAAVAAAPDYARDVTPILRTYCAGCHNDRDREGGLSVERYATLRKGGEGSGDPVAPGKPAESVLLARIASRDGDHMPPNDSPQPPAQAVETLAAWIAAGAAAPAADPSLLETLSVPSLRPHAGPKPVTGMAVSPDGKRLAVARGRTIEVRDAAAPADAAPLFTIADLPGRAMAVRYSADGLRLVVGGGQAGLAGFADVREAAAGGLVRRVGGHRDVVHDAELSPDGSLLATAGYDRAVKLWRVEDGAAVKSIDVHDGPVFELAWHPSGKVLASASADETVKLWRIPDGLRLDTLKEPLAEVFGVAITPDGGTVLAAGRDKRIHAWKLVSLDAPAANPPLQSRFAHESPIVAIGLSADGRHLLTSADDRSLKCWSVPGLVLEHEYPRQPDVVSSLVARPDGTMSVGRMDGSLAVERIVVDPPAAAVAAVSPRAAGDSPAAPPAAPQAEQEPNDSATAAQRITVPAVVKGAIGRPGDTDCFRFAARAGETLVLEVNAARSKSKLDSRIEVLDAAGAPLERVVLQAVRDSWFTFRGKDSNQSDDFRVQNWREMELDEYLYAGGEVVRLWHYPRGPDSGFIVYPGEGARHTFFGTTPVTHALGEPAWIVEPLPPGASPAPNGLPVFRIPYENDDEPTRRFGADSQLLFTAPADGEYVARIGDVRGFGAAGDAAEYAYTLEIRPPAPSFAVSIGGKDPKVSPGSGREIAFTADRNEGFEGPVRIAVSDLPPGFTFHGPLEIAAGQRKALGVLSAAADAAAPDAAAIGRVKVTATGMIAGREVVKELGTLGEIKLAEKPKVTVAVQPGADPQTFRETPGEPLTLLVRPGQTIAARVKAERHDFANRIELGGFDAGRNLPHAVYVDNIGLNGLLIVEGQTEREFFITAAPIAKPGRRIFHIKAGPDGGQCSPPIVIEVLPPETVAGR